MSDAAPLIYSRIAQCLAEVGAVGKDHRNQQQGYNFRGIDDFYDAFQPVLAKNKVFIAPTILEHTREERATKSGGVMMTTITKVRFRIYTEDGSFIEADALGEGADSGDKSANKAAAQAMKYLFMQVFSVRVNGESFDSEKDSPEYKPRQAPQNAPRQQPPPRPQPAPKPAPQANQERKPAASGDVLPKVASESRKIQVWDYLVNMFGTDALTAFLDSKGWSKMWPLPDVPASNQDLSRLVQEINDFIAARQAPPTDAPQEGGDELPENEELPSDWADVIFSIAPKGTKKQEWLDRRVTLGQMYQGSAEDKKRLFAFAKGDWKPEHWIDNSGAKRPPSQEDVDCRIALDLFLDWRAGRGQDGDA